MASQVVLLMVLPYHLLLKTHSLSSYSRSILGPNGVAAMVYNFEIRNKRPPSKLVT